MGSVVAHLSLKMLLLLLHGVACECECGLGAGGGEAVVRSEQRRIWSASIEGSRSVDVETAELASVVVLLLRNLRLGEGHCAGCVWVL